MAGKDKGHPPATIGNILGISARRVQQLAQEGVLPKAGRGRYQLVACVQAYIRYWQDRAVGHGRGEGTNGDGILDRLREMKHRIMSSEAALKEHELAKLRRESMPTADALQAIEQVFATVRGRLLNLPAKVTPDLVDAGGDRRRIRHVLATALESALRELSTEDLLRGTAHDDSPSS